MKILKEGLRLGISKLVLKKKLLFCSKKISPTTINLGNADIDPNLNNLLYQLNNLSEKETNSNENIPICKYRNLSPFSNLDVELKNTFHSFI